MAILTRVVVAFIGLVAFEVGCTAASGMETRSPVSRPPVRKQTAASTSVLEHHNGPTRDGVYVDPKFTKDASAGIHLDTSFNAAIEGAVYAQPLFVSAGPGGKPVVVVATEQNWVYALDANSGAKVWEKKLGDAVSAGNLPCGNIDPLGVTGTPIIDLATRSIFLDAMTTPDGGITKKHLVFSLSIDDGSVRSGWPADLSAQVSSDGVSFDSAVQNQRGALAFVNGVVYVPFGGHFGDCGVYHGWVVGIPISSPASPKSWRTRARGGAVWAPGGVVSDGTSIYVATGNTFGASTWSDGEALIRLAEGPVFSGQPKDYFSPPDWQRLDQGDIDLGGVNPTLIDLPGSSPSSLIMALGKDGKAYLVNRDSMGGVSSGIAVQKVAQNEIISAPSKYDVSGGTAVVFKGAAISCPTGQSGDLMSLRIAPGSTPNASPGVSVLWCAAQNGLGSPIVSTTDGKSQPIVWSVGAEGDNRLRAFDGQTGQVIFNGGSTADQMSGVRRYSSPILANGKIYIAADGRLYAFVL